MRGFPRCARFGSAPLRSPHVAQTHLFFWCRERRRPPAETGGINWGLCPSGQAVPSSPMRLPRNTKGRCGDFAEDCFRIYAEFKAILRNRSRPWSTAAKPSSQGPAGVRGECTLLHSPRRLSADFDARKRPLTVTQVQQKSQTVRQQPPAETGGINRETCPSGQTVPPTSYAAAAQPEPPLVNSRAAKQPETGGFPPRGSMTLRRAKAASH